MCVQIASKSSTACVATCHQSSATCCCVWYRANSCSHSQHQARRLVTAALDAVLDASGVYMALGQKISIVDTFVFVFIYIIKIKKVFVIVSISHK